MSDPRREDRLARSLAQREFERPVVLEAGAGTGKTACLVARIVGWVLGPGWERAQARGAERDERIAADLLSRVAAITFTEAAAAEMGERVGLALEAIAQGSLPVGVEDEALPPDADLRARRATALRGVLDQLRVQTIHAFCRRILAEHPVEAGLHPRFTVDADGTEQAATVRGVLEDALPALFSDSEELLALVRAGHGVSKLEETLLFLLEQGVTEDALRVDPFDAAAVDALFDRLAAPLADFVACDGGRLASLGSRARKVSATADALAALAEALPTLRGDLDELRSRVSTIDVAAVKKWGKREFGVKGAELLGDDRDRLGAAAERLLPSLAHVQRLDPELLRAALRLVAPLHAEVRRRLRARGVQTFGGLLADTRELLRDDAMVRGLTQRSLDQILVDEFQDTDPVQCDIVRALALDGPRSTRPGLFLVGDPKQSIYGWRRADLAAYESFVDEVLADGGVRASLVVNYRSTPRVLDEVARLFRPTLVAEPGVQPGFEVLLPAEGATDVEVPEGRAPIEYWVNWAWDPEERAPARTRSEDGNAIEAVRVAEDLALLGSAGVAWREMALLFRAGTGIEPVLQELRRRGVPFAVEGDRSYYERREVVEATALLRCILDPNDHVALVSVLRSQLVGVPDAALLPLWRADFPARAGALHGAGDAQEEEIAALVAAAGAGLPAEVPGLGRIDGWEKSLSATLRALGLLRESFGRDPADVFIETLRELTLLEAVEASRYLGAYRLANLDRFFRDLRTALQEGEGDPEAVLQQLRRDVAERREREEGRPREAIADAVQVMTIHKAKGLDFDHVYLLQMQHGRAAGANPRAERVDGRVEFELFGVPTLGYDRVAAQRDAVERAETVRTLYVAATRARHRLVLSGVHRERASRPSPNTHVELVEARESGLPDLLAEAARCDAGNAGHEFEFVDARFVFTALRPSAGVVLTREGEPQLDPRRVEHDMQRLIDRRREAAAVEARPTHATMSELDEPEPEALSDLAEGDARVAAEAGTRVHAVLEHLDLAGDVREEVARAREALGERVARQVPPVLVDGVVRRADAVLSRFAQGELAARLAAIAPHVVARELDVFLPPSADGPVGFVAGAIDLLYRDPDDGGFVVADYKTDRTQGDDERAEKAARYAAQGEKYVAAVQEALQLPTAPRFELWFLDADEIVVP